MEPAYRSSDGMLATEGIWELPCRADVIRLSKDTSEAAQFDPQHDLDGMKKNRSKLRFFNSQRMAPVTLIGIRSWQSPCTD